MLPGMRANTVWQPLIEEMTQVIGDEWAVEMSHAGLCFGDIDGEHLSFPCAQPVRGQAHYKAEMTRPLKAVGQSDETPRHAFENLLRALA